MNIVNKLTIRHLKQNKRRTLVTIIGVIISVAMITAVATLSVSFLDLFKRQNIADEGNWHVVYQNIDKEQLEAIKKDDDTKSVAVSREVGFSLLSGGQNEYKSYLYIKGFNEEGFNMFPIELSEGRLPKSENEIVLSEAVATNGKVKYELGDSLDLTVGHRFSTDGGPMELTQSTSLNMIDGEVKEELRDTTDQIFKVVGFIKTPIWEPAWSAAYTSLVYVDKDSISETAPVDVSVELKKVENGLYEHAEKLAINNEIEKYDFHSELLRYYGVTDNDNLKKTLYSLSAIIMAIIIIGSVALIFNAFTISVSERSRHLGMLASVGATKRQKRNSVFFEGFIIAVISIPIGILSGILGIGVTFWAINKMLPNILNVSEKLVVTITPSTILVACVISFLTIGISTYLPARKASKVTAIDAIRQTGDVKLSGRAVKTSKLIRKIFGIEAEIGLKNIKRNKRRYRVTVFSIMISIVLFLAVSFFTDSLKKSAELSQHGIKYDIQVSIERENADNMKLQQSILSLKDVAKSTVIKELMLTSWIEEKMAADELKGNPGDYGMIEENGNYLYDVKINSLDDTSLKAYANEVGIDYEQLNNTEKLGAIIIDKFRYEDYEQGKIREVQALHTKVGQSLDLYDEDTLKENVEVLALTNKAPMGVSSTRIGGVTVIVSERVFEKIADENKDAVNKFLYLNSADPLKTQTDIEDLNADDIYIYNVYQARQNEQQLIDLISIFTYGFIVLITLISIANIFNTISTSVSLRKREFAMLKSMGMTPKGFNKMLNYESIFYGVKSLLYGLPISFVVMYLIYRSLMNTFGYEFALPWMSLLIVVIAVFVIVMAAMLYSISKVKKENIIDAIKQENI